ncbi:MAG: metal-dependent transcriptional regulator [Candidatus Poseidonia sp.]|nr:metal-dependent transcriptional regulator [Poseidonia sp.]MBL6806441.1 metal-dependent transcriptional regulator [Poseidonia sp.]MBL6892377.1 metal-dependent transcriptional regulator [Poseidonia sp.]
MVGHFQEFEDEYLETMYEFYESDSNARVRTGDLASRLRVSPASATEMVQRLAKRGYLDYVPYKGAMLTPDGLVHGRKMKRRHRLAEVLLEILPYEGNAHETACRLEHAIDDDLEVALSALVGSEGVDPSGRPIPKPTEDIALRLASSRQSLSFRHLTDGQEGVLAALLLPGEAIEILRGDGIGIGSTIVKKGSQIWQKNKLLMTLSDEWMERIFVTIHKE